MRNQLLLRLLAAGALGALVATPRSALAQSNVNLPLPNVMLLVDSSGSMEWKPGEDTYPLCDSANDQHSRWGELLEVLTGSIQDYHCSTVGRGSSNFRAEYSYAGVNPPDYRYQTPYHRPVSGTCTPGPGSSWTSTSPYQFPTNSIVFHQLGGTTACTFNQLHDGLISTYGDQVRFGLMTFDTNTNGGTGINSYGDGVAGTWSYFLNSQRMGRPAGCTTDMPFEVGARNAAAPPWEGRMVPFGKPDMSASELSVKNDQMRQILLATRPFGATPIAGLLDDAREFLKNDQSNSPLDATVPFGPSRDPYVQGGCRKNYLILLTDGEPNLELRPYCEPNCPYQKPEEIAADLLANGIKTFVIGFSLAQVNGKDCSTLDPATDCAGSGCYATTGSVQLRACCCLNAIAAAGNDKAENKRAYFASDRNTLRAALSKVLSDVATGSASRTLPVFAASGGFNSSSRFFTSFVPGQLQLWQGVIDRQRYVCEQQDKGAPAIPMKQTISRADGDDFVYRVNSNASSRQFYSVRGAGSAILSEHSVRPVTGDPDGIGEYSGSQYNGKQTAFVGATDPSAMSLTLASSYCGGLSSPEACRDLYLKWLVGLDNGSKFHRCPFPGADNCSLVADVFHSTPAVVGPPSERLQDESYQEFAATRSTRPAVLYTSTNDGFLHAFKLPKTPEADPTSKNELWAFIPPAVLPAIPSEYPGNHALLLDGAPVVRDVVATQRGGKFYFERASVADRGADPIVWRTVLVQSFGGSRGGYFAVDVTDPDPDSTGGGPQFLWQLTTNSAGDALFGLGGATPLITSLFFDLNNGIDPKEVAVAVLPGGVGDAPLSSGTGCAVATDLKPFTIGTPGELRPRVNCYPSRGIAARSLTIVRLDTGEIIRSFRVDGDPTAGIKADRITKAPLNSPMTGEPAAYPGSVGTLATQLYLGDADGVLWRVDVASPDPGQWSMHAFFDAYGRNVPGTDFNVGQPIPYAPKVSTDAMGQVTVAFATGDQQVFQATTGMKNYVWSLTETVEAATTGPSTLKSTANWAKVFADGDRVSGPLYLFNAGLYFSTFAPAAASSGNACVSGNSMVWGMDYVRPATTGSLYGGGAPMLPLSDTSATLVQSINNTDTLIGADATIFGVTVAQLPTCGDQVSSTDTYFGTGQHTSVSNINTGKYQLIMQTGKTTPTGGGQSSTAEINLASPRAPPRIDSWAAVVEWP
jgi:type IV pilus assembly protein PilY1